MQGFCAETGGAITLFGATWLGIPVSTTHTITGAIIGVGAARRLSAVRWSVAGSIVVAWIITIPAAGLIAALSYWAVGLPADAACCSRVGPFAAARRARSERQRCANQAGVLTSPVPNPSLASATTPFGLKVAPESATFPCSGH